MGLEVREVIMKNTIVKKPWGHEEILAHTPSYVVKKMVINPGQRMSLQYHEVKEETIFVHSPGPLVIWTSEDDKNFLKSV